MLFMMRVKDRFGYVDATGHEVVPSIYKNVGEFTEGRGWLITDDGEGLIVDVHGQIVGSVGNVDELGFRFSDGYLSITRNGKVGFVDTYGRTVVSPTFDSTGLATDGLTIASLSEQAGIYRLKEGWWLQPTYKLITPFCKGSRITTASHGLDEGSVIIDCRGALQSSRTFFQAFYCNEGLIPVSVEGGKSTYGWVNEQGETVMPGTFDYLGAMFNNGIIAFEQDGKWGLVDKNGSIVLAAIYRMIGNEVDGLRRYCEVRKIRGEEHYFWGYLNNDGTIVIEAQFDGVQDFQGPAALAYFRKDRLRHYFWINRKGGVICKWRR